MLIVRSHGIVSFTDKDGHLQKREGPVHVHFLEDCLKNYFKDFFCSGRCFKDAEK